MGRCSKKLDMIILSHTKQTIMQIECRRSRAMLKGALFENVFSSSEKSKPVSINFAIMKTVCHSE